MAESAAVSPANSGMYSFHSRCKWKFDRSLPDFVGGKLSASRHSGRRKSNLPKSAASTCSSRLPEPSWSCPLLPGEILEEIYTIHRLTGEKISHVVVMGTGEPLDNYENLLKFLRMLTDENGQNLSMRNVTVSTCGIVPRIYDLAREKLSITLALSLHATTDERRREIMPIANTYTISECMAACRYYFEETGRRVTFEYSLIKGVNDSLRDAKELAALAGSISAHINLIPVNPMCRRTVWPLRYIPLKTRYRPILCDR